MKHYDQILKRAILTIMALVSLTIATYAGSDGQYKSAIVGAWSSARHTYIYKINGLILLSEDSGGGVTGHWSIRNGILYERSTAPWANYQRAYKILAINDRQLVYKGLTGDEAGYVMTLYR